MYKTLTLPNGNSRTIIDLEGPKEDAPTLLLLHGLGVTAYLNWSKTFNQLTQHYRVIALDHRGHGSGLATPRFSLEQCADDAALVLDILDIPKAIVVGYSMGGPISKLLWKRHPEKVIGLVLAATSSEFGKRLPPRRVAFLFGVATSAALLNPRWVKGKIVDWAVYRMTNHFDEDKIREEFAGHKLMTLVQAINSLRKFSSTGWLGDIDVPVSVVVTTQDDRVLPEYQYQLARAIRDTTIVEVPGDHTACITLGQSFAEGLLTACESVLTREQAPTLARAN